MKFKNRTHNSHTLEDPTCNLAFVCIDEIEASLGLLDVSN
jgi:hypothetical protein